MQIVKWFQIKERRSIIDIIRCNVPRTMWVQRCGKQPACTSLTSGRTFTSRHLNLYDTPSTCLANWPKSIQWLVNICARGWCWPQTDNKQHTTDRWFILITKKKNVYQNLFFLVAKSASKTFILSTYLRCRGAQQSASRMSRSTRQPDDGGL